jgi:hypothetical protein
MSEVSTWDPVDANNNSAPPNGFPENMAPSGLNDGCRAIMGAVRRWYNTVTAALAALPTTYLSLTGGTLRDGIDIARFDVSGTYNVSGSWSFISDLRLKDDIEPYTCGLDEIMQLTPVSYYYKPNAPFSSEWCQYGLIAQDVEHVIPEMVGDCDGMLTLAPTHLVWPLINSVKTLAAQNAALAARVTALENRHHV